MLELIGVTIRRGHQPVLTDLTLRIEPGHPFWVVGPNGAGKSSLLRVLAGLDRAEAGRVRWRTAAPPRYCHSEMRVPGTASVGDWAHLGGLLIGETRSPKPGLWPDLSPGRRIRRLSTGERKRLLLDMLLRLSGPLLLDEPFEHLSPDAKAILAERLRERAREHVVIVASNQATGIREDDRGIRIEAGQTAPLRPAGGALVSDRVEPLDGRDRQEAAS